MSECICAESNYCELEPIMSYMSHEYILRNSCCKRVCWKIR